MQFNLHQRYKQFLNSLNNKTNLMNQKQYIGNQVQYKEHLLPNMFSKNIKHINLLIKDRLKRYNNQFNNQNNNINSSLKTKLLNKINKITVNNLFHSLFHRLLFNKLIGFHDSRDKIIICKKQQKKHLVILFVKHQKNKTNHLFNLYKVKDRYHNNI